MATPNNRALVEALKLHKEEMKKVLPLTLRRNLDQFFDLAEKVDWSDEVQPDGTIKLDPKHFKPTHYTGRMRWLEKTVRWTGSSQAEYSEKKLQQEVLVCLNEQWYQEWVDIVLYAEDSVVEGDPVGYQTPTSKQPMFEGYVLPEGSAWLATTCSTCGAPQYVNRYHTHELTTCPNGHDHAPPQQIEENT